MPDHWQETTLGEIADLEIGKTPPRKASQYWTESLERPFCSIADMDGRVITPTREGVTELAEDDNKARRISAGSLLMSFKLTIGRMAFAGCDLFPNEAIVAITPNEASASREFLYLNLGSRDLTEGSGQAVKGKTLNSKSLRAINVHLPSLEEQRRIVDLVGSIDTYIDSLETQIETTRTARSALLSELLSNSGDDWQETILGHVVEVNPKEPPLGEDAPFVPMDAVNVGQRWVEYTEPRGSRSGARARAGDVLFARITPCLENGKTAQVQPEIDRCGGSTEFIVLRGTERLDADFLYFWATDQKVRDIAANLMTGSTGRQRLSSKDLAAMSVLLPPRKEQRRIVDLVGSFDEQISSLESQVESVRAFRSGVLSELLSGERLLDESYDVAVGL